MAESIPISPELKALIEKYLKETNDKRDLLAFVNEQLMLGLKLVRKMRKRT